MQIQNNNILLDKAISIIDNGRKQIIEAIYNESTKSYYRLGELIVSGEQQGKVKAEYGKKTIENLSKNLTLKYGKGFSVSTLWDCKKFYVRLQSLTGELRFKLSFTHYTYLIRLEDDEMKFYEQYAVEQNLTVKELQKAVQSNTILRVDENQKVLSNLNCKNRATNPSNSTGLNVANMPYLKYVHYNTLNRISQASLQCSPQEVFL